MFRLCLIAMIAMPALAWAQPEVDTAEVLRRGDSIEYVDGRGWGGSMHFDLVRNHPDIEKFFVSILYRRGDRLTEQLADDWRRSRDLLAFANPDDRDRSWAHFRAYDLDDASQRWRFDGIRVGATPTILIQPCRSGAWGDPSTVVMQRSYRGDPKALADDIKYSLRLYAAKLGKNPPRRQPMRTPIPRVYFGDAGPAAASYAPEDLIEQSSAPWLNQGQGGAVEIPPLYQQDDQGQCPGPGPCPRPSPEPDQSPPGPWSPGPRPYPTPNPLDFDDSAEYPPRKPSPLQGGWQTYALYALAAIGALYIGAQLAKGWMGSQGVPTQFAARQPAPRRRTRVEPIEDLDEEEPPPAPRPKTKPAAKPAAKSAPPVEADEESDA